MPPIVYVLGTVALLILLLTVFLARRETSLMAGGIIASFLLLAQFLWFRFEGADSSDPFWTKGKLVIANGVVSLVIIAAYLTFVTIKSIRGHGREDLDCLEDSRSEGESSLPEARPVHPAVSLAIFFGMAACALWSTPQANPWEPWSWGMPDREVWGRVLMFPAGLLGLLGPALRDAGNEFVASWFAGILATMSYLVYAALFWGLVRSRQWSTFWMVACVLAGILVLNVAGSRVMLKEIGLVP